MNREIGLGRANVSLRVERGHTTWGDIGQAGKPNFVSVPIRPQQKVCIGSSKVSIVPAISVQLDTAGQVAWRVVGFGQVVE